MGKQGMSSVIYAWNAAAHKTSGPQNAGEIRRAVQWHSRATEDVGRTAMVEWVSSGREESGCGRARRVGNTSSKCGWMRHRNSRCLAATLQPTPV